MISDRLQRRWLIENAAKNVKKWASGSRNQGPGTKSLGYWTRQLAKEDSAENLKSSTVLALVLVLFGSANEDKICLWQDRDSQRAGGICYGEENDRVVHICANLVLYTHRNTLQDISYNLNSVWEIS